MKTTIDLPDAVLRSAKVYAARHHTTLKQLMIDGLQAAMTPPPKEVDEVAGLISALSVGRNSQPVGRLRREDIYDRPVLRRH